MMCQMLYQARDIMENRPQCLTTGASRKKSTELKPQPHHQTDWTHVRSASAPLASGSWSPGGDREQTGDTEEAAPAERGLDSKSPNPWTCTFPSEPAYSEALPAQSCFSFPKEPKGRQTSARDLCQPLPPPGIWAERQQAFGWRNSAGSVGCACGAHFAMSCGGVRKIETDGSSTSPSARTSRWSRQPKMSKAISQKAQASNELHNKFVREQVWGYLLDFSLFFFFLWWWC